MVIMDQQIGAHSSAVSNPNENFIDFLKLENNYLMDFPYDLSPNTVLQSESSPQDCDFSDKVLNYINKMLMEEDMEDKTCMLQESSVLQAAEKPFYEILGEQYPPPAEPEHRNFVDYNGESSFDTYYSNYISTSSGSSNSNPLERNWVLDLPEYKLSQVPDYGFQPTPPSSFSPSSTENDINHFVDGLIDSRVDNIKVADFYEESRTVWNFNKGVEEANKFLPNYNNLYIDLESKGLLPVKAEKDDRRVVVKEEKKDEREKSPNGSRGKKNVHRDDIDLQEGRSNKQSAVSFSEEPLREDMDRVLLCHGFHNEASNGMQQNGISKVSNGGKSRGKKQGGKRDVVDLRTLLIHCAQAIAADDRRTASELLKQIRQHSSPFGDGNQRLAHCFADGLEARLAGTGSQKYSSLLTRKSSAADTLKAYQLYLTACPFKKLSHFVTNQTIMKLAENETRVHIVDFGIYYGFQWPCLLEKLAARPGGPPKLRITGIDLPQPGFRPAQRVEETGHRLADYAKSFNLPFEYHAIAQKWETIQLEDIKIDPDELLIVNCMYRFRHLLDETVVLDSPRGVVLRLIRKMNPAIFVQGILNGAYNAPFFVTRFREALFYYSSLFDMFEANVPREHPERILLETNLFGRDALNVIACEGPERVERPETYKQWQIRHMRAGFEPVQLNKETFKTALEWIKKCYHKDFVLDQDGHWMLQGWKGRIMYAISLWRPLQES